MSEFLSDEWLAALDAAAHAAPPMSLGREAGSLVLDQVVHDVPGRGEVRYHVVAGSDGIQFRPGPAHRADVVFTTDCETAVSLARGETNAQQALARGRLRIGGDLPRLLAAGAALGALDDVFAAVRDATLYPARRP